MTWPRLIYDGLTGPIAVSGSAIDEVGGDLNLLLPGWPCRREEGPPHDKGDITVDRRWGRYAVARSGRRKRTIVRTTRGAAEEIGRALMNRAIGQRDDQVGLHAGAVRIGSGAVLLMGEAFVGKTSIVTHLAAAGHHVVADDCVIVRFAGARGPSAVALGFAMLIRLPLPEGTDPAADAFVAARSSRWTDGHVLVRPNPGEGAAFGEETGISALVHLQRDATSCEISAVSSPEAVRTLTVMAWNPRLSTERFMGGIAPLAIGLPTFRLRFHDSADAARLLRSHFGEL